MINTEYHDPVLLNECLDALIKNPSGTYADCTLGGGGHSFAIVSRLAKEGHLHCFDRDPEAIAFATKRLEAFKNQVTFHPVAFAKLSEDIAPNTLSGVLYDLGISSHQVDDSKRGFTFQGSNPLDLRMDTREAESAQQWLRRVSADEMAQAFRFNADLDRAYKLSLKIIEIIAATEGEILPENIRRAVESVFPDKRHEINGILARVFQAIRMEVNGELRQIEESLRGAVNCLLPGGRLVVISYHSVEDRCVKNTAAEFEKDCLCPERLPVCSCGGHNRKLKKWNRKPILPSAEEIARNPRARSAKLRVYEKV